MNVPSFGNASMLVRAELDDRLVLIVDDAIATINFSLLCGFRGQQLQQAAFASGASKVEWPHGKHNRRPALAFDFRPFPFDPARKDWSDIARFGRVFGHIESAARRRKIPIRWGGDFNQDERSSDDGWDWGHVELL